MSGDIGIGSLIEGEAFKDAIHVAVAPVVAGEILHAGDHIGITKDHAYRFVAQDAIGIVDPFLKVDVKLGQKFYMFLYPGTITSLRHNWSHPAFIEFDGETGLGHLKPEDVLAAVARDPEGYHRRWLQSYADRVGITYAELMEAGSSYQIHDNYLCEGDRFEGKYVPDEFWEHYNAVTGFIVEKRGNFFSCSC